MLKLKELLKEQDNTTSAKEWKRVEKVIKNFKKKFKRYD